MIPIPVSAGTLRLAGLALSIASILALGFWGGYRWQAGNVADAEKARDDAKNERDLWQHNAQSYKVAIAEQKAANEAAIKASADQQRRADRAIAEARTEKDKYERKLAMIEASIEKDKTNPTCKAELEKPVCGAPWQ